MKIAAMILMGGEGSRFDAALPKQFQLLAGKKVFLHTLEAFLQVDWLDEILLVCHPDWEEEVKREAGKAARVTAGGKTRQESSYKGLISFSAPPDFVLIHDAVRPFISRRILEDNRQKVLEWGAVDTCIASSDTLVHAPEGTFISSIPPRSEWLRGQTPQTFRYELIVKAHEEAKKADIHNASDDCQLVLRLGHKVAIAAGDESNIKITQPLDLLLAEQLLRFRTATLQKHDTSLQGKRLAVLGGFGGIGSALCQLLEQEGAVSIPLSRKNGLDLTRPLSIKRVFQELGSLDGLINCAGALLVKPLEQHNLREIKHLVQVNFTGLVIACQQAQIIQGGHIINIASSAYTKGRKNCAIYSAAKAAVVNFTQALAEERPELRVHALVPHRTSTSMRKDNFPHENPSQWLQPIDVAKAIIALLKDPISTGTVAEVRSWLQADQKTL